MNPLSRRGWPGKRNEDMHILKSMMVGLGLCLLIPAASAQILPGTTNIASRVGQVILPERLLPDNSSANPASLRPPRQDIRPELPASIKLRIVRFENLRETYLARQEGLLRKLRGATDAERDQVRRQLQQLRDEWLDRARAFREEAKTRMRELRDVELPKYRESLTDAKEGALDAVHKRRGDGDH